MAFNPSSEALGGGLSVDLQKEIERAGHNPESYVTNPPWIGSVRFAVGELRGEGFKVGYDPLPPDQPYHGEVWGSFTSAQKKKLKQLCEWFVPIEGVALR